MEIEFVPAKAEDARFLSEMRRKVWLTTYRGIYPDKMLDDFDYKFHDNKNLSMINSGDFSVYFISEKDEKIGYLILQHKNPLYVQSLYLLEKSRGKGIGKKAFEFIRGCCRENGIDKFYLGCHPENKNALGFYEKWAESLPQGTKDTKTTTKTALKLNSVFEKIRRKRRIFL